MRIATALFTGSEKSAPYERMAAVLAASAAANCPAATFMLHRSTAMDPHLAEVGKRRKWLFQRNAMKAHMHNEIVQSAPDGEELCLIDCDTLILRDLTPVWDQAFDIAVTVKPATSSFVFNSGVVFLRVSEATRLLYAKWYETTLEMLGNEALHKKWKPKWGGIHQAAFGWLLENYREMPAGIELPCDEWNSCKDSWPTALERARVVHLLEPLKKHCLKGTTTSEPLGRIADAWRDYERQARAA